MKELQEKDFIQEPTKGGQGPLIFFLFILFIVAIGWGIGSWRKKTIGQKKRENILLQVSNRDFSIFLWENPQFMRPNKRLGSYYLEDFDGKDKIHLNFLKADKWVQVSHEVLFIYHTWKRLVGQYNYRAPISPFEFKNFVNDCPEWRSINWPNAPKEYKKILMDEKFLYINNLQELSYLELPLKVRKAFLGLKAFYKEGEAINTQEITYGSLRGFLRVYPNFSRNLWLGIYEQDYPNYLLDVDKAHISDYEIVPYDHLSPLLRFAFYQYQLN